jgi:hypothetical protein
MRNDQFNAQSSMVNAGATEHGALTIALVIDH